jgi:hypothetical protein
MAKIDRMSKLELEAYCQSLGIYTAGKNKSMLVQELINFEKNEILSAIANGKAQELLVRKIEYIANEYSANLTLKIESRKQEMMLDDNSHYLVYRVLGISNIEGRLIDEYQNTGRFLYKYAGSFLEDVASLCLKFSDISGGKAFVPNNQGKRPKNFEIDFLNVTRNHAIEIKWRDATTDGDHITKEHTRVKAIQTHGYIPIRVMFYYPQREQAKKIQETLKTIYSAVGGQYYAGDAAWSFIKDYTGYDLKGILEYIADRKIPNNE